MSESQENTSVTLFEMPVGQSNIDLSLRAQKSETGIRVIKRYQNRKLYDTVDSCYITFKEILDLVIDGQNLHIEENATKKDITDNILLSSLADHTKDLTSNEICNILAKVGKFIKERGEKNGI